MLNWNGHILSHYRETFRYVMNVSGTSALTRELNPLEAPFLPADDPRFLWLKYQILIYFEDGLKTIKVRPRVYKKSETKNVYVIKSL